MTIIIETPAPPPVPHRLVLVPVGVTVGLGETTFRDATPADLARGGYARGDASLLRAHGDAEKRAEKAERERDEAVENARVESEACAGILEALPTMQQERDEARAELATERSRADAIERANVELHARLTAPVEGSEGEPTDNELRAVWDPESTMTGGRRALFRAGVAHERARHAPAQDRATDEELDRVYSGAYNAEASRRSGCPDHDACRLAGLRAVAARVRRKRSAEVERLRGLVRWFLDGDDCAHEDDCGARGNHDLDVCRNTKPCADETCDGPHCTCEATMMRDRARAALGEP